MEMYTVIKRLEISGAHELKLPYPSPCSNLHGHNWIVEVSCRSTKLNEEGMVVDFAKIKKEIHGYLDHQYLNCLFDFNPTAENMAKWICEKVNEICKVGYCFRVTVQESEGNIAIYERGEDID